MDYQKVIADYFDCYRTKNIEKLRGLLTNDFRYLSPFCEWNDRDKMLAAIWPSVTGEVYATNLEIFGEGPSFLVRYQHSGETPVHIAEHFRFAGDKISEIEVYLGINSIPGEDS